VNAAGRKRRGPKARERAERERRIEQNNPEGAREEAAATANQVKQLAGELGITRERAKQALESGSDTLDEVGGDGGMDGSGVDLSESLVEPESVIDLDEQADDPILGIEDEDIGLGEVTQGESDMTGPSPGEVEF
jgi:hypothetical protein